MSCAGIAINDFFVTVFTDGGCTNGMPAAEPGQIPHLNAVVAFRGSPLVGSIAAQYLSMCRSFDEMKQSAPVIFGDAFNDANKVFRNHPSEIYVAGFSEEKGAAAFVVASHKTYDFEPYTVAAIPKWCLTPAIENRLAEPGCDVQGEILRIGDDMARGGTASGFYRLRLFAMAATLLPTL